ncbi:hypothetical protein B0H14DRAFT_2572683 [Mycena olivaceomarginata]|nr:hypothetical protein B0H14DRAFT_2572683 [Mycena olivaceomarginata]
MSPASLPDIDTLPDALHCVDYWRRNSCATYILGLVAGHGLLTTTGEDHKQLRKAMTPALYLKLDGLNRHVLPALPARNYEGREREGGPRQARSSPCMSGVCLSWSWSLFFAPHLHVVGKVALDIICDTVFGYKTDCLHNPHNEFAVAFEQLLQLQSGPNLAKLVAILSIPGTSSLSRSQWMYRNRWLIGKLPIIHTLEKLVESLYRIRAISRCCAPRPPTCRRYDHQEGHHVATCAHAEGGLEGGSDSGGHVRHGDGGPGAHVLGTGHETTATGLSWIRAINTWKDIWGDDACVLSLTLDLILIRFYSACWFNLFEASFLSFPSSLAPYGCIGKTMAYTEPEDSMSLRVTRAANKAMDTGLYESTSNWARQQATHWDRIGTEGQDSVSDF